jgi:hypothetical protein
MEVTLLGAIKLGFGVTVGALGALLVVTPVMAFGSAFCWSMLRGVWNGVRRASSR